MQDITRQLLRRPIAYQPIVAKAFGSVKLAVLWCQLQYWTEITNDPEGWIYKNRDTLYYETGLTRKEQESSRKLGRELGVVQEKLAGKPATMHFRIVEERAGELVEQYLAKHPEEGKKIGVQVVKGLFGTEVIPGEGTKVVKRPESTMEWIRNVPADTVKELATQFSVSEQFVKERAQDVVDYCEAKGKKYSNYKAALRNFIKTHRGLRKTNVVEPTSGKYERYAR